MSSTPSPPEASAARPYNNAVIDWAHARLSRARRAVGLGLGLHALVVADGKPLRLTQAQREAHPAWHGFSGVLRATMRSWWRWPWRWPTAMGDRPATRMTLPREPNKAHHQCWFVT